MWFRAKKRSVTCNPRPLFVTLTQGSFSKTRIMGRIIYLAIIVIDVLVIIDIVKSSKDTEKKILWIIAVVLLPVLGPILYYVVGRNNIR